MFMKQIKKKGFFLEDDAGGWLGEVVSGHIRGFLDARQVVSLLFTFCVTSAPPSPHYHETPALWDTGIHHVAAPRRMEYTVYQHRDESLLARITFATYQICIEILK